MGKLELEWIGPDDSRMAQVHELRHEALFAPFGLPRDDRWDDAGEAKRHVIASLDGRVVGYASLLLDAEGTGHVRQVSVREELRRAGVGSALMREIDAEGKRLGLVQLWLNARVTAEPFYQSLGWRTVSGVFPSGRTGVPHVRMEKSPGW
ncbi:GNAT family N-acetyltransferase [bacterium]|nr:GNAT family N-acetyltransferase [bacterium]